MVSDQIITDAPCRSDDAIHIVGMSETAPPVPPKITAHDRKVLRDRLTKLFKARGLSGRRAERSIGVATGTISKVFAGKMSLTHRLLLELATLLNVTAEEIVRDTAFNGLLQSAVATPETEQVTGLQAELDRLRVEKQGIEAALVQSHEDIASVRRQMAEATAANHRLEGRLSSLSGDLSVAQSDLERLRREMHEAEQKERAALVQVTTEREQRTVALAKMGALSEHADRWRTYAIDRQERVKQLEAYAQQLQAQIAKFNGAPAGAAVGGGLLGLALGAMLISSPTSGTTTSGSRRRRS